MATNLPVKQWMMVLSIAAALATMGLKYAAWTLTGSVGLFSDAAESVVNLIAAGFGLFALRVSARPPDAEHAFGHHKVEYFASGLESFLILVAAVTIFYAAVERIFVPAPLTELGVGLGLSLVASVINAVVAMWMLRVAKREDSIVLEADAHHLLTDVWTSIGVLAGLTVLLFAPDLRWLDPAVAIAVAANVVRVALVLGKRSLDGLMDAGLPVGEQRKIERAVSAVLPEDMALAHLRTMKAGSLRFIVFDLLVPGTMTVEVAHALCDKLEAAISAELSPCDVTIHVEPLPRRSMPDVIAKAAGRG